MSVETDIFDALKALVNNRVYPAGEVPAKVAKPYITYQQVGGKPVVFVESVHPGKANGRFQFNTWATTSSGAAILQRQVEVALVQSATLRATVVTGAVADYEGDTKLHGRRQDFSIWFTP